MKLTCEHILINYIYGDVIELIRDSPPFYPKNRDQLRTAIDLWCCNPKDAESQYGHIRDWDTSLITDMYMIFADKHAFNEDLGNWDVSCVEDMGGCFWNCYSFQGKGLERWNITKVGSTRSMFSYCHNLNCNLETWNLSNVKDKSIMFNKCYKFNPPSNWNLSNNDMMIVL